MKINLFEKGGEHVAEIVANVVENYLGDYDPKEDDALLKIQDFEINKFDEAIVHKLLFNDGIFYHILSDVMRRICGYDLGHVAEFNYFYFDFQGMSGLKSLIAYEVYNYVDARVKKWKDTQYLKKS